MWTAAFAAPWIVFGLWWAARARGNAATARRESRGSRIGYFSLFAVGAILMSAPSRLELWTPRLPLVVVALLLSYAGVAFAIWAREHLGRMWSGAVTLKEDHRLIRSGPYRIVRHPIYTGLLTGLIGVALTRGNLAALVAIALFVAGFARKISLEERLLSAHFGEEYANYRRETRALIPFLW